MIGGCTARRLRGDVLGCPENPGEAWAGAGGGGGGGGRGDRGAAYSCSRDIGGLARCEEGLTPKPPAVPGTNPKSDAARIPDEVQG
jgi:hypothetical protein